MNTIIVRRAVSDADRKWLHELWMREWGGPVMAVRGYLFHVEEMECLIAWKGNRRIGAVAYLVRDRELEIMSLNSLEEGTGAGTALLRAVEEEAEKRGMERICLITTNDNLDALRFYQKRGYCLSALWAGAVDEARKFKPSIPLKGNHGIPIRDELELEKRLMAE
jgi:GNAT superfamily N-acetyltransferase